MDSSTTQGDQPLLHFNPNRAVTTVWRTLSMLPREHIGWGNDALSIDNWWLVIVARLKPGGSITHIGSSRQIANIEFTFALGRCHAGGEKFPASPTLGMKLNAAAYTLVRTRDQEAELVWRFDLQPGFVPCVLLRLLLRLSPPGVRPI